MKKTFYVGVISMALVMGFVVAGCASTYYGQYDASVPMKEQCLLKIGEKITVTDFDGEKPWNTPLLSNETSIVSIPAGQHGLQVRYSVSDRSRIDPLTGDYRQIYKTDTVAHNFEPGNTYEIAVYGNSDVRITHEESGNPRSSISVPEHQLLGFGIAARSLGKGIGAFWGGQHGTVIDSDIVTSGIYWEAGFGMGVSSDPDSPITMITYTGVSGEFYPPGKSLGLGLGAGVASPSCFLFDFSPYLRATLIPVKRIAKLKLYFEYYLPEIKYVDLANEYSRNNWGLGLTWFY
jgi:hypothetical protein